MYIFPWHRVLELRLDGLSFILDVHKSRGASRDPVAPHRPLHCCPSSMANHRHAAQVNHNVGDSAPFSELA